MMIKYAIALAIVLVLAAIFAWAFLPPQGSLDLCPAKQNVIRPGHAASRSLADR